MSDDNLTKLHVDLPRHELTGGESLWAEDLGDDLYRIRNVPFFAYGLNFYDVVLATPNSPELKPEVRKVVKPSGHRTLRVIFLEAQERQRQIDLLTDLKKHNASYERADDINVAIDIEPEGSYSDVFEQLRRWEEEGLLSFESCEARENGSFDDVVEGD